MNFQEQIRIHLGLYKSNVLGVVEKVIYNYKGKEHIYSHILPTNKCKLNIIDTYREQFFKSEYSKISYHRYFHHLNSSQALCINFFFPFIIESNFKPILELLALKDLEVSSSVFEYDSDVEVSNSRKTSFDFFIQLQGTKRVYVEVKYTEQEFGRAKSDHSHKEKFIKTYLPLLENNIFIKDECKTESFFLKHYQIMRNLVHINEESIVVFLYPKANRKIDSQAKLVYENVLTTKGKEKLKLLFLEDAVTRILETVAQEKINTYFREFKRKYLEYIK